jgi:hypothetical protein
MPSAKVITFGENPATATYADGLAFIERTRRQLDRMDATRADGSDAPVSLESAAEVRGKLDWLEASIRKDLGMI